MVKDISDINLRVDRISKVIELHDMIIVRYKNPLLLRYVYKIYFKNGGYMFTYSYSGLLDIITLHRQFN